jgi:hypothetical protein
VPSATEVPGPQAVEAGRLRVRQWSQSGYGQTVITAAVIATAAAAANTRAKIHDKTRWAGKNFDFYSGIHNKNAAAMIATAAAAANTRAKIHYKTRGAVKNFDFYSGIYVKFTACSKRNRSRSSKHNGQNTL